MIIFNPTNQKICSHHFQCVDKEGKRMPGLIVCADDAGMVKICDCCGELIESVSHVALVGFSTV